MADDDQGDKTEQPTDRRREQAREQGNIARSTDLGSAAVILTAISALAFIGPQVAETLTEYLRASLAVAPAPTLTIASFTTMSRKLVEVIGLSVLPLMVTIAAGSLAINLAQTGFLWAPELLQPNFGRINPLAGFQRLFSKQAAARLVGSLLKLTFLAAVAYVILHRQMLRSHELAHMEMSVLLIFCGQAVIDLGLSLAVTLFVLAVADYGFQWWSHEQELKMTKEELRQELKDMDGNPETRMRRRELHRRLTAARELGAVRTADVVITNPTEIAVAIKYDPATMNAPTVVAKGMGEIAAQIRKLAAEHGVPIIERKPVARYLYKHVKVGRTIPPEMYDVFIEILSYVYRITGKKPPLVA